MDRTQLDHTLVRIGGDEWHFEFSPRMEEATERFDAILDNDGGRRGLTVALRNFLNGCPGHIDALHHYSCCKLDDGKILDAFAFSHAAVAIGRAAMPDEFHATHGRLPRGWIENRPFLRALHGLCLVQHRLGYHLEAAAGARELLHLDPGDGMGARMMLPLFLLAAGLDQQAIDFFKTPEFQGAFHTAGYLHALALIRIGCPEEGRKVLDQCIDALPEVARYLVHNRLPVPEQDFLGGMVVGGAYEGWTTAVEQDWLWHRSPGACEILAEAWEQRRRKD